MAWLLLLTLPPALWLLYRLPTWESVRDYKAIKANGSQDSLHEAFHAGRAARRGGILIALAFLSALPLWHHDSSEASLMVAVALLGGGWFFYRFNTKLSELRGLDPWYLSADSHAAYFPDRLLTRLGWSLKTVARLCLLLATVGALLLAGAAYLMY